MKRRLAVWFWTGMLYLIGPFNVASWQYRRRLRKLAKNGTERGT